MTNQQGAPEALAHELFTAAQLAPGEGISDAVARIAALVEAQQPAPSAAAFDEHGFRDWVLRNLPKGSIIGNGEWWADHLTSWAKRFVKAAPQPSPTPQADSVQDLQPVHDAITIDLLNERVAYLEGKLKEADSVLEDAARLDWLALAGPTSICVVIDRPHDSEVEVATDDVTGYGKTLREALDAAIAAQGGKDAG